MAGLEELVFDLVGDGGDVALAAAGDEQEDIDERQRPETSRCDEVFAALGVGSRAAICSISAAWAVAVIGILL